MVLEVEATQIVEGARPRRPRIFGFVVRSVSVLALVWCGRPAHADDDAPRAATQIPQFRSPQVNAARAAGLDEIEGPTIFEGIGALNPIDALRDDVRDRYGFYLHGVYLGDPYANLGGGLRRGATFSGRLDVELDVDAKKAFGLNDATFHANMFGIHGTDLSTNFVGNLLSINDIAALPTARLYELWYEQRFGDKLSVRVGQQGIDVEFLTSNYGANFINATFGWPGLPSVDLPDGGPAYPLATPAVRLRYEAAKNLVVLAAAFDGTPAGPCAGEPQTCDLYGLDFRVRDPPLVIAEAQYRYNQDEGAKGLPGTLKLGAYAHFGRFDDERYAAGGRPLAIAGSGMPAVHALDGAVYGIADQQIYRVPGDEPERGVGVFVRAMGAPPDRNLVDFYADAGFSALGIVPGRPRDSFGIAAAVAKISAGAAGRDTDRFDGLQAPIRSFEAVTEVTYQAEIVPGLAVQPSLQYIVHPGGNVVGTGDGRRAIPNATVFGVTTVVRF